MKRALAVALLSGLFLWGCGKANSPSGPATGAVKKETQTMTLLLFSAPWCLNCKDELTQLNPALATIPKARLNTILYVLSGDNANIHPTQAIATAYAAKFQLSFTPMPDPWQYTNYRHYIQGGSAQLPAAVLLDHNGKVLHPFLPGTYTPGTVLSEVRDRL